MFSYKCPVRFSLIAAVVLFAGGANAGVVPPEGIYPKPKPPAPFAQGCEVTWKDTDDFSSYIRPGWQSASPTQQKLLIISDTQPFRVKPASGGNEIIHPGRWRVVTNAMADILREERAGARYVPLILNGDITEYGHGNEREAFREFIKRTLTVKAGTPGGPLFFPGLGNHDYSNNLGSCANNGCARDAVCDNIIWTRAIEQQTIGMNFDHAYVKSVHKGSLSYSFDVGKVHVVQLHNEPTYTATFETGGSFWSPGDKRRFEITSSLAWLKKDLAAAKARGQYTIINMHKPSDWKDNTVYRAEFKQMINDNGVVAVFAGHYHSSLGKKNYSAFGKVPVFLSGAVMHNNYLRVMFDWRASSMRVEWFDGRTLKGSHTQKLPAPDTTQPLPVTTKPIKIPVGK